MSIKLRDFIKQIRAAKTAAEERCIITNESASIRNAFKEQDSKYRHRNVAKLLYVQMMGYPTYFGQLESIKLIASPKFADKRIGYLALGQLMEEDSEVLTLAVHSIKSDLASTNQYVAAMALSSIGCIGNSEMARSHTKEIEGLLTRASPYIKKKAIICAARMVSKAPEIEDRYNHFISTLLNEKLHGVLLACCAYIQTLVKLDSRTYTPAFRDTVPVLLSLLKNLLTGPHSQSAEWHIQGIADPFLQMKVFETLRMMPQETSLYEEQLSDIFSILSSTSDITKNISNAVVLEGCKTLFALPKTRSLHSQGVNLLGKFLAGKDANVKGVALQVLRTVIVLDVKSISRHWDLLVDALLDSDNAVKRPALETMSCIINEDNVVQGVNQMTKALVMSEVQFKYDIAIKTFGAIESHSPSPEWQMQSMIKLMSLCTAPGTYDALRNSLAQLVQTQPSLQKDAAKTLFFWLKEGKSPEVLLQSALWIVGEFSDLLVSENEDDSSEDAVSVDELLSVLKDVALRFSSDAVSASPLFEAGASPIASPMVANMNTAAPQGRQHIHSSVILEYLVTCFAKLTARLPSEQLPKLQKILKSFNSHAVVEIQQRACEYQILSSEDNEELRIEVFDRMPVSETMLSRVSRKFDDSSTPSHKLGVADLLGFDDEQALGSASENNTTEKQKVKSKRVDLFDLEFAAGAVESSPPISNESPEKKQQTDESLLSDLLL